MKKYLSFLKIRFIAGLQYRSAAVAGILTQLAWGIMTILMFRAFYEGSPESFPMPFASLSGYIWLQQATFSMFALWFFDEDIFSDISSGNIAYELARPTDLYSMWFTKNMALRLSRVILRSVPMIIVAALLPEPYGLRLPPDPLSGIMFLLSLVLAFLVVIAFLMLIYISAFYTTSAVGVKIIATTIGDFLAGSIIPIPFFPPALQSIIYALPFAYMQSTPFLIYTGQIEGSMLPLSLLGQLGWLLVLTVIGKLLTRHALKRVAVAGG